MSNEITDSHAPELLHAILWIHGFVICLSKCCRHKRPIEATNEEASAHGGIGGGVFQLTISIVGAMFAPKPFDGAREMVRVTKPGGRIVMGNWIPNDPTSFRNQLLELAQAQNKSTDGGTSIPATFLRVTVSL